MTLAIAASAARAAPTPSDQAGDARLAEAVEGEAGQTARAKTTATDIFRETQRNRKRGFPSRRAPGRRIASRAPATRPSRTGSHAHGAPEDDEADHGEGAAVNMRNP
jgi:hypothetical protein